MCFELGCQLVEKRCGRSFERRGGWWDVAGPSCTFDVAVQEEREDSEESSLESSNG